MGGDEVGSTTCLQRYFIVICREPFGSLLAQWDLSGLEPPSHTMAYHWFSGAEPGIINKPRLYFYKPTKEARYNQ